MVIRGISLFGITTLAWTSPKGRTWLNQEASGPSLFSVDSFRIRGAPWFSWDDFQKGSWQHVCFYSRITEFPFDRVYVHGLLCVGTFMQVHRANSLVLQQAGDRAIQVTVNNTKRLHLCWASSWSTFLKATDDDFYHQLSQANMFQLTCRLRCLRTELGMTRGVVTGPLGFCLVTHVHCIFWYNQVRNICVLRLS